MPEKITWKKINLPSELLEKFDAIKPIDSSRHAFLELLMDNNIVEKEVPVEVIKEVEVIKLVPIVEKSNRSKNIKLVNEVVRRINWQKEKTFYIPSSQGKAVNDNLDEQLRLLKMIN